MGSAQSGEKNQALQKLSEQGWNRGWGWDYLGDKNYLGFSRIRTRLGLGLRLGLGQGLELRLRLDWGRGRSQGWGWIGAEAGCQGPAASSCVSEDHRPAGPTQVETPRGSLLWVYTVTAALCRQ